MTSNQYTDQPFAPPPPKPSRWWLWLLGGLGCGGVLLLLCCGGFSWWGFSAGTQMMATILKQEVADNDAVKENLGEITSMKMNLAETGSEQKARGGGGNLLVFDAVGTKGSGKFIVETLPAGQAGPFSKVDLRLPDGKSISIK